VLAVGYWGAVVQVVVPIGILEAVASNRGDLK